ncbi:MAG TPA: hypothetical protein VK797_14165 [Tepidisphaeraceae bacterium]|nr:hypothetical protein [Tepidisphaeraceae bacterium]
MKRLLEILLGLDKGFLSREGAKGISFNPVWPGHHPAVWNVALALLALALIVYVYRRDGRSRPARILLGTLRALLVAFVLMLLNRPVITNSDTRTEPSVLAVMIDDTASMKVPDVGSDDKTTRLDAARNLFTTTGDQLLRKLEWLHTLRFYKFDNNAAPFGPTQPGMLGSGKDEAATKYNTELAASLGQLKPDGQNTQLVQSLSTVLDDLQGQRLAGVVVLSDGRETPRPADEAMITRLREHHVKIFPVAIGGEKPPPDIYLTAVQALDVAFKDDIVSVKVTLGGTGYEPNHPVHLSLKDETTGLPLIGPDGRSAGADVLLPGDKSPVNAEVLFKPDKVGTLKLRVIADRQAGELDYANNELPASVDVVDSSINVLYVDGYPRWEYRYIKNGMIRDTTVNISCLLTSADVDFKQEGDPPDLAHKFPGPITRFPESLEELMPYDVVLFGDVDPREFTDRQLQLIADFVEKRGGGFGMVAGPRWSPIAYRNSPLEAVLPVNINRVQPDDPTGVITEGFRPVLTPAGEASTIFRFFPDAQRTREFMKNELQPIFWYCQGVTRKSIGQVFAEHPFVIGPDGQKAPLLVVGRYGAGRTLFNAICDSWRWRFYIGENVFNGYWVQQLRYLARGKKIGARDHDLFLERPTYNLGDEVRVTYRVYNPEFQAKLPAEVPVQVKRDDGTVIAEAKLQRQEGQTDLFAASFVADHEGEFTAVVNSAAGERDRRFAVKAPRVEMEDVSVNQPLLNCLALETNGKSLTLANASTELLNIPSLERKTIDPTSNPLTSGWLPLIIFVALITGEWVLRKVYGML